MNEKKWAAVLIAAALAIGGGWYYLNRPQPSKPEPEAAAQDVAIESAPPTPAPAPDYPVPEPKADVPALPAINESDAGIREALSELIGASSFEAFLVPDMLIRRIVVTVDNLPRDRIALNLRPQKRTPPPMQVMRDGSRIFLSPANAERYSAQAAFFTAIDADKFVALYFRWYPLFQRAYVDLGYPGKSFNNRLVEVLDHLLAAPLPPAEIELVQPKVVYEFADPKLEALSIGQKVLLRLNATQRDGVMKQLRAIRAKVAAHAAVRP